MEIVKIIGVGLIATIILAIIRTYKPELTIYVSIIAGAIIFSMVMDKLSAIIDLLTNLSKKSGINAQYVAILLKISGIAILSEFAVSVCKDLGETAVATKIDLAGKIIIISISIPIISALLELLIKILP
ncbi:MAG: stage III sporulation protein AD [Clostridia bacterium]